MLLQPYTSRVVTENQAGNVIPDNAVPVQKAKASISTRNRTLINEILMRWENSFAMHQGGTTGRSPHGVKQKISGQTSAFNAIACREGSFSYTQRNHSLNTG